MEIFETIAKILYEEKLIQRDEELQFLQMLKDCDVS